MGAALLTQPDNVVKVRSAWHIYDQFLVRLVNSLAALSEGSTLYVFVNACRESVVAVFVL